MKPFNEILGANKIVLIDFFATWCGPCQTMSPILKEVKDHFGDQLAIIKIDVDKNPAIATNYQVRGVPTLVLFKESTQVWRQSGLVQRSELVKLIEGQLQA